jgi:lysophospholipase L1-like esterase
MIECMVIGDSIAVGVQAHLPRCELVGKSGLNSGQFNAMSAEKILEAKTVIVSLGSNEAKGVKTSRELIKVRARIAADRVIWIMPQGVARGSGVEIADVQEIIVRVASIFNDRVIAFAPGADGIHPAPGGYKTIAEGAR